MSFGEMLREARVNAKLTQEELAARTCTSRSAIYDWEHNKYVPTDAKNIKALEETLGFEHGYLYSLLYLNPTAPPRRVRGRPKGAPVTAV